MFATLIIVVLILVGVAMTLYGVIALVLRSARRIEQLPWMMCGLALCAFAVFDIGGQARRDARVTSAAFRGATTELRKTEASYRQRTGRWQTDPDALSLQTGCWGVVVDWVGPAGKYFEGFSPDTEVAILHASSHYEVVSVDERAGSTSAEALDVTRRAPLAIAGHGRAQAKRLECRV